MKTAAPASLARSSRQRRLRSAPPSALTAAPPLRRAAFLVFAGRLRRTALRNSGLLLFMSMATGCSSAPPPPKEPPAPCVAMKTILKIGASPRVNAVAGGDGRPVQVRIYLLKNDTHLKNAQFE